MSDKDTSREAFEKWMQDKAPKGIDIHSAWEVWLAALAHSAQAGSESKGEWVGAKEYWCAPQPAQQAPVSAKDEIIIRAADTLDDLGAPINAKELRGLLPVSAMTDAHELWAVAQLMPNEGIEDGVARIKTLLSTAHSSDSSDAALEQISQWAKAYPLDIFPEPDWKRSAQVLKDAGLSLDAISAANMRHVITKVQAIVDAALSAQSQEAQQDFIDFDWLETEVSAIDTLYRGSPTYERGAGWFKDEVLRLIAETRKAAPHPVIKESRLTKARLEGLLDAFGLAAGDGHIDLSPTDQDALIDCILKLSAGVPESHSAKAGSEQLAWESTTPCYTKFVTDSRYQKLSPKVQKWYKPICQKCAQQAPVSAKPIEEYPAEDQRFYRFWYDHMLNDLMQPPLCGVDHATARYVWDAALASQLSPVSAMTDEEIDKHLEVILRASGSSLRHYTLPKSISDMRDAMRKVLLSTAHSSDTPVPQQVEDKRDAEEGSSNAA